jgi:hypothetical protein
MRPNTIVGTICLMSAAAFAACQPAQSLDVATADSQPLRLEAQAAPKAAAAKPKKAVAKADGKTAPALTIAANASSAKPDAVRASTSIAAKQDDDQPIAATITGCLELRDDGMFQLKDTDGDHAPKARSWKSGFVKKGSAKIDVFDAGNRLKLGTHVGHRVSISGTLTDRQMRARSLETTSDACE